MKTITIISILISFQANADSFFERNAAPGTMKFYTPEQTGAGGQPFASERGNYGIIVPDRKSGGYRVYKRHQVGPGGRPFASETLNYGLIK